MKIEGREGGLTGALQPLSPFDLLIQLFKIRMTAQCVHRDLTASHDNMIQRAPSSSSSHQGGKSGGRRRHDQGGHGDDEEEEEVSHSLRGGGQSAKGKGGKGGRGGRGGSFDISPAPSPSSLSLKQSGGGVRKILNPGSFCNVSSFSFREGGMMMVCSDGTVRQWLVRRDRPFGSSALVETKPCEGGGGGGVGGGGFLRLPKPLLDGNKACRCLWSSAVHNIDGGGGDSSHSTGGGHVLVSVEGDRQGGGNEESTVFVFDLSILRVDPDSGTSRRPWANTALGKTAGLGKQARHWKPLGRVFQSLIRCRPPLPTMYLGLN